MKQVVVGEREGGGGRGEGEVGIGRSCAEFTKCLILIK